MTAPRPQAKFSSRFHKSKSKANFMDFSGVKARSALGTSTPLGIQVCQVGGWETCRHGRPLLLPHVWLFPLAKTNSSSDTIPGRLCRGRRPWHTAERGTALPREGVNHESTRTLQSHRAAGGSSRKGSGKDQGTGRATAANQCNEQ